jgi:hypothetical protein
MRITEALLKGSKMKKIYFYLIFILITMMFFFGGCAKETLSEEDHIQDFTVSDVPNDDGTGLVLQWHPLDKNNRIIKYNIYRGHRPDSLFLLESLEVDPKVSQPESWLNYTDKDYNATLISFETAPGRLKKEKQQVSSGTLYGNVPRDPKVLAALLPHYDVLALINTPKYYKPSKRIELNEGETKNVYAGYNLNQFETIFANPKAEHSYYYCVVPVNETGRFLPATPILSAIPYNNRPDTTAIFYANYIKDTGEFRFEWSPPSGASNIVSWEAWLMPRYLLPQYYADQKANAQSPDSIFNANWQKGSIFLKEMQPEYWGQNFYDKTSPEEIKGKLSPDIQLSSYIPVLSYTSYWSSEDGSRIETFQSASLGKSIQIRNSKDLPEVPKYQVLDKPNDKGDNIVLSLGRPFAYVTQATFIDKEHTKFRVNYEISTNSVNDISKLLFRFLDSQGRVLDEVKEGYTDKIIYAHFPKNRNWKEDITVQIYSQLSNEKEFSSHLITQKINYDSKSLRFSGGDIYDGSQNLSILFYDIFRRTPLDSSFYPGMRFRAISRSYDQTVPYPETETVKLLKVDLASQLVLLDPHFTVALDEKTGATFRPSLFKQDTIEYMKALSAQIDSLSRQISSEDTLSETAKNLAALQEEKNFIISLTSYQQGIKAKNDKEWRKILRKELDLNTRSYEFRLLLTNSRGLWANEDDLPPAQKPQANIKGRTVFLHPEGEWFDTTKYATLIATILMGIFVVIALNQARHKDLYIRPIAGLEELDNAVGRATEMGRPVLFVPGWGSLGDPDTVATMMILNRIARKTAEYDIRLISPQVDYLVLPLAQEMVKNAYDEVGRPDAYNQDDIFFVSDVQFAFSAAVNGIIVREKVATVFYMGYFFAEALLMTETGNQAGAVQIAGTDAITQIPFFITTCDYTLIGEEFYATSAYLSRNPDLVGMLKSEDYFKIILVILAIIGVVLSSLGINTLLQFLPIE